MMEAQVGERDLKMHAAGFEHGEGHASHRMQAAFRSWKNQGKRIFPKVPGVNQYCQHPTVTPENEFGFLTSRAVNN